MSATNLMTPRAFAASLGFKPHYGNQLVKDGRLVMAPDGKHVLVAESKERLEATRDPSKQANVERHAAARAEVLAAAQPGVGLGEGSGASRTMQPPPVFPPLADEDQIGAQVTGTYSYQEAKAKREHWAAEREHAAWRKEAGELMERGEVSAAFADAGTTVRSKLEAWAAVLPPQLVGRDEAAIRGIIADQVEQVLQDLVQAFQKLAGDGA